MVKNIIENGKKLFSQRQDSILSAATILMFASLISRAFGLLRDRLLAGAFFAQNGEWQLDVYNAAFRIPDMLFQLLILGALSSAFIPVYSTLIKKDKQKSWLVANSLINLSIIGITFFSILFFIFSKPISYLIAPSFNFEQINLMIQLTRIMLVGQVLLGISSFYTSILQSHQRFFIPAIAPIFYNFGIIFGIIFLSPKIGIYGPTFGVLIGYILHLLIQLPLVKKLGFKFQPQIDLKSPEVRKIGKLMLPRTLSLAVEQIELTIAVMLSSAMTAGSLSIFYFAQHLFALPIGIFGITIGQAALPMLSKQENVFFKFAKFKSIFLDSLNNILYLSLPASVLLLILRIPIVRIAIGAKNFPWEATLLTGKTLAILSLSIAAYASIQLLIRAFYAIEDTKTPLYVCISSVLLNVFLSILFTRVYYLNIAGLALATTLTGIFQAITLFILLYKKINGFNREDYLNDILKMFLATLLTGIALWIPMRLLDQFVLDTTKTIDLIILTVIASVSGLFVYIVLSLLLKIKQLDQFIKIFQKFGAWKNIFTESEENLSSSSLSTPTPSPEE